MQAGLLLVLLWALASVPARADGGGTSPVNILPAGGKHRGILLKSQTVDVVMREEGGTVWGDTRVWLNLYNPASKPITVTVTLPGPQLYPLPLPHDLSVRVGKAPLRLTPAGSGESQQAQGEIGVPARSALDVYLEYRQALPEMDGRAVYAYMLNGAEEWAGTIQSLRVTIVFRPPLGTDQLLTVAPRPHREDGQTLNWHWETEWAKTRPDVALTLVAPGWWRDLSAARAAAAEASPTAEAHLALAQHYLRLASTAPLAFEGESAYHDRYYPKAAAELHAAIAASDSPTDTFSAHTMLADLYRQEAARSEGDKAEHYLQSAAAEVQAAAQTGLSDSRLAALAEEIYANLLAYAERRGDQSAVDDYRRRLAAATGGASADRPGDDGTALRLRQALAAAARGDYGPARAALAEISAPARASSAHEAPPLVREMALIVETRADRRVITLDMAGEENIDGIQSLIEQTAGALSARLPDGITAGSQRIVLALPFADGDQSAALSRALAAGLPAAPELALLRAALAGEPRLSKIETYYGRSTWRYEENVDLTPAVQEWESIADNLASAGDVPAAERSSEVSALVAQLQQELCRADAAAWRELARNSHAEYRLALERPQVDRAWQVAPTASRLLQLHVDRWDFGRLRWAPVAVLGLLIAVAAVIWRAM